MSPMKLSNFVLIRTKGNSCIDFEYFAEVDVTTGSLWWKKTTRKTIKRNYIGSWHFTDTGKFTPGFQAEELERAWKAKIDLET
jgi:hypothetical protein